MVEGPVTENAYREILEAAPLLPTPSPMPIPLPQFHVDTPTPVTHGGLPLKVSVILVVACLGKCVLYWGLTV